LRVLESAPAPQATVQSPLRWSADASWKRDYNNVAQMSPEELARRRREFDAQKDRARHSRKRCVSQARTLVVPRRGLPSAQPDADGCQFDEGEGMVREFVGSGGDTPALLHRQNQTTAISEDTP
jgi:hypothetical protein